MQTIAFLVQARKSNPHLRRDLSLKRYESMLWCALLCAQELELSDATLAQLAHLHTAAGALRRAHEAVA